MRTLKCSRLMHIYFHTCQNTTHMSCLCTHLQDTSADHIHPSECLVNLTLAISQFVPLPESFHSSGSIQARKPRLFFNMLYLLYPYKHIQVLETSWDEETKVMLFTTCLSLTIQSHTLTGMVGLYEFISTLFPPLPFLTPNPPT